MGTVIKVKDLDLSNKTGAYIAAPVLSNLEYFGILNTDAVKAQRNFAKNKLNSAIVGTLGIQSSFVTCNGYTQKINTEVSETTDFTYFIVCKSPVVGDTGRPIYLSNMYTPPADNSTTASTYGFNFVSVREVGVNAIAMSVGRGTSVDNDMQATLGFNSDEVDGKQFGLYMCRVSGLTQTLHSYTVNLRKESTSTQQRYLGARKISIGGGGSSNNLGGQADIALVAMYSSALTDEQCDATADFIRNIMFNNDIVV